jgi:hypothetical protein
MGMIEFGRGKGEGGMRKKLKVGSNWKLEGGMRKAEKTEGGKVRG